MKTFSVQQMPNGFEVDAPSFTYWVKAGVAFTLGAGVVYVVANLAWLLLVYAAPSLIFLRMVRLT